MTTTSATDLEGLLKGLAGEHKVPGAAVAVLDGNTLSTAATGVVSMTTGVEVTPDTLFQIGSITKVFTATLVMQLVDEGKVELDAPVRRYVPELRFRDPDASEAITVRHLLTHTSGVDGSEHYPDTGRGDDCVAGYVASCAEFPQISPPGAVFSYNNVGFVVAGRLVEHLTGLTWDVALRERICAPLAMERTVTLPEEAILHRVAVGHAGAAGLDPTPVAFWSWPRSIGPAGTMISTAGDLLSFVRMHLGNGPRVLSPASLREMQEPQVELPDTWFADGWGIGWMLFDRNGRNVIGHTGGGVGQIAVLQVVPDRDFAVAVLTNSWAGQGLANELVSRVLSERLGIEPPDELHARDDVDLDPSRYVGTYARMNVQTRIEAVDGGLVATMELEGGPLKEAMLPVRSAPLRPVDTTTFLFRMPDYDLDVPFVFFDFDESGRPRYLHSGGRASPRVGDGAA